MQTTLPPVVASKSQVIVLQQTDDLTVDPKYDAKQSFVLGIIELGSGVIVIIVNSFVLGGKNEYIYSTYGAGPAIWCGIFFILAGILCLVSVQIQKKLIIHTSLAMNIISSIFGFYLFLWPDARVVIDAIQSSLVQVGMGSVLLLLSLLVCVVSIWNLIIRCMSCCQEDPYTTTSTVITTVPAGTVVDPEAIALQNLPTTQVINTTGPANVAYAYQSPVTNQQIVTMQPQFIQTASYPQQQVIQTAAYPQPQPMMQPGVNPQQVQMAQPPAYPHQPPVYHQPPAPSAGSYGKSDANDGKYEALRK